VQEWRHLWIFAHFEILVGNDPIDFVTLHGKVNVAVNDKCGKM
jgi:hypothetical protein